MAENQETSDKEEANEDGDASLSSPVLLLKFINKAICQEFRMLCKDCFTASRIQQLSARFAFMRLITKHHSTALEEIIFPAIDSLKKNTTITCLHEDEDVDLLYSQLFEEISSSSDDYHNESLELKQKLSYYTEKIFKSLSHFIVNEESQGYSLLYSGCSFAEQGSLVWHYLSSMPFVLLEKFLLWLLMSPLSSDEKNNILKFLHVIVPKEKPLQEVLSMCLEEKRLQGGIENFIIHERSQTSKCSEESWYMDGTVGLSGKCGVLRVIRYANLMYKKITIQDYDIVKNDVNNLSKSPLRRIIYWKKAVKRELKEISDEAYKLRYSGDPSNMSSLIDRLHFFVEICAFHSSLKENILSQAVEWKFKNSMSVTNEHTLKQDSINDVRNFINNIITARSNPVSYESFSQICIQTDMLIETIKMSFMEKKPEASSVTWRKFSVQEERSLFYESLCVMPLRLLKHVLPWLSARLSNEEAKEMLETLNLAAPYDDVSLVRLFSEWIYKGYKEDDSTIRNTNYNSLHMEKNCLPETRETKLIQSTSSCGSTSHLHKDIAYSHLEKYERPSKRPHSTDNETEYVTNGKNGLKKTLRLEESPNLQISVASFASSSSSNFMQDTSQSHGDQAGRLINNIILYHKAINRDLEYLDEESARIQFYDINPLQQFSERFFLLKDLYQLHRKAEHEFIFPALATKEAFQTLIFSYNNDYEDDQKLFEEISNNILELKKLHNDMSANAVSFLTNARNKISEEEMKRHSQLLANLHSTCNHLRLALKKHFIREELELFPLFDTFSIEEQDKILGYAMGNTGAETLQTILPWLAEAITQEEWTILLNTLLQITRNTKFSDWIKAWQTKLPKYSLLSGLVSNATVLPHSGTAEPFQVLAEYLSKIDLKRFGCDEKIINGLHGVDISESQVTIKDGKQNQQEVQKVGIDWKGNFVMNQEELEFFLRKISSDESLEPQKKAYFMQTLMASGWMASQQLSSKNEEKQLENRIILRKCPSYCDERNSIFGCEHYKRSCKMVAACCGKLFTCRRCHDDVSDHEMDRGATKEMMCMVCLYIQPIAHKCATPSCEGRSMARYYCDICKFFDGERKVYHCPFCNICRVGKGLGIDFYHCMKCNGCMSMSLKRHKCREKEFESNCPICHDFLFTSTKPVKALPCGHSMHSSCFRDYTFDHYTCPICSKSMGDMTVYFGMLDALVAADGIQEIENRQTQDIKCNDCEKRGQANFHWLYHKCRTCGSYNTRVL